MPDAPDVDKLFPDSEILIRVLTYYSRLFWNTPNAVHVRWSCYSRMAAFENILDTQISWVGLQNSNPVHPSAQIS